MAGMIYDANAKPGQPISADWVNDLTRRVLSNIRQGSGIKISQVNGGIIIESTAKGGGGGSAIWQRWTGEEP